MHETIVSIKLALENLRSNIGRTALTLIGIVIGITSVIVIMASGEGIQSYILGQIQSFGTDVIQVEVKVPSTGKTSFQNVSGQVMGIQITTLKEEDARAIKKLPNVEDLYVSNFTQEVASYQNINKKALLFGTSAEAPIVDPGVKIAEGSFFSEKDDHSLAQVAVIGSDMRDAFFGTGNALGENIRINSQNYKVIGVLDERGVITGFNFDEIVYLPVRTLQKKILGVDYLRNITVKVKNESFLDATALDIEETMRREHGITNPDKDDFSVTSMKEAQDMIGKIFGAINILLLSITSIALIVGGVGIMNVMYVAVAERAFEIGLRKAVGAKPGDILKQFLWEAIFITFIGGVFGVMLGFIFSSILSYVFLKLGFGIQFSITWQSVFLAVGFSVAVGIIFGYYPACNASRLSPMEAIRRE